MVTILLNFQSPLKHYFILLLTINFILFSENTEIETSSQEITFVKENTEPRNQDINPSCAPLVKCITKLKDANKTSSLKRSLANKMKRAKKENKNSNLNPVAAKGKISLKILLEKELRRLEKEDKNTFDPVDTLMSQIISRGYPIELHEIETDDGYKLTVFRIKHGKNDFNSANKIGMPVMLQHGLLDSSAAYLASSTGLAYYLADSGYDVWVGNSRGTMFSRKHKDPEKDPDKEGTTFWNFSFHEMGIYDLPNVLQHIRSQTDNSLIHYIGMSMGTTQFFVMGSELPQNLDWLDHIILMAPISIPKNMELASGSFFRWSYLFFNYMLTKTSGEVFGNNMVSFAKKVYNFCNQEVYSKICEKIMKRLVKSSDENLYDFENAVDTYLYGTPGTSAKTYIHYLQMVEENQFQQYNYCKNNEVKCDKKTSPPKYKISNVNRKKLYLIAGGADNIAHIRDVEDLHEKLTQSVLISIGFESFTHRDFHYSKNIEENLYKKILEILQDKI